MVMVYASVAPSTRPSHCMTGGWGRRQDHCMSALAWRHRITCKSPGPTVRWGVGACAAGRCDCGGPLSVSSTFKQLSSCSSTVEDARLLQGPRRDSDQSATDSRSGVFTIGDWHGPAQWTRISTAQGETISAASKDRSYQSRHRHRRRPPAWGSRRPSCPSRRRPAPPAAPLASGTPSTANRTTLRL